MKTKPLSSIIAAALTLSANAAPKMLPFQGHLTQSNGDAVDDGTKVVQFKIYDAPVSGNAVWAGEVHKLSVNQGLVNTILGTKTAFPGNYAEGVKIMFSEPLYMEITVDANSSETITAEDPPLLPRQVILPANFAHVAMRAVDAETLKGVDLVENGQIKASAIETNGITKDQLATGAVGTDEVSLNSLTKLDLARGSVESDEIADGTIQAVDLSEGLQNSVIPPGAIMPFAGAVAKIPPGWLPCDGRALDKDADGGRYQSLYNAIGESWGKGITGSGNAAGVTEFNVPDLRGVFLRGVAGTSAADPNKIASTDDGADGNRFASPASGNSGNQVGSFQGDGFEAHRHLLVRFANMNSGHVNTPGETIAYARSLGQGAGIGNANFEYQLGGHTSEPDAGRSGLSGGLETRPKNAYVNYIIKY